MRNIQIAILLLVLPYLVSNYDFEKFFGDTDEEYQKKRKSMYDFEPAESIQDKL